MRKEFKPDTNFLQSQYLNQYCTYHRSNTHNTEDCRSKETPKNKKSDKINVIKDCKSESKNLIIDRTINTKPIKILLDTSTSMNYISDQSVNKLELNTKENDDHIITMANGKQETCNRKSKVVVAFFDNSNTVYEIRAWVLKCDQEILILGTNFMKGEKAIINYSEGTIILNGNIMSIPEFRETQYDPERKMIEKFSYCNAIFTPEKAELNGERENFMLTG